MNAHDCFEEPAVVADAEMQKLVYDDEILTFS